MFVMRVSGQSAMVTAVVVAEDQVAITILVVVHIHQALYIPLCVYILSHVKY